VRISVLPGPAYRHWRKVQPFMGVLQVYEARNQDYIQKIKFGLGVTLAAQPTIGTGTDLMTDVKIASHRTVASVRSRAPTPTATPIVKSQFSNDFSTADETLNVGPNDEFSRLSSSSTTGAAMSHAVGMPKPLLLPDSGDFEEVGGDVDESNQGAG